ncbi:hypothetical protein [Xanthomonas albilineans]|uniref:Uncharacterized protein n=1 Tax=Xanthomonas albilineans (strain GPE PC73 / CFBP 7063) TaxID=380358 RepID=D2U9D6_XANAP|nr:hypothetical protein [Xanthomonas albilineans]QHQ29120.1 hypothetical protein XaFJ1_GM002401 [Xanthomonas albilineans]CBA16878.1 hypothetical protein XALC_2398 [Xanthomonas albilineans GPE PC73]
MQSQKTARPLNFSRVQNEKLFLDRTVSELSVARDYKADLAQIEQIDATPWTAASHADMTSELKTYARS